MVFRHGLAYEMGYRSQINDCLVLDIAGFYNDYDNLLLTPVGTLNSVFTNAGKAKTYGVEISTQWRPSDVFELNASYSYYQAKLENAEVFFADFTDTTPRHSAQLRTSYRMTDDITLNANAYYTDSSGVLDGEAYIRFDLGVTWQLDENTRLTLQGQNLLDEGHREGSDTFLNDRPTEVQRGVFVGLTKEF